MKYRRLVFTSVLLIAVLVGAGFLLPALAQQKESAAKAQKKSNVSVKLEYKVVEFKLFGAPDDLEQSLNKLGDEGWDYVATVPRGNDFAGLPGLRVVFKRPKALP